MKLLVTGASGMIGSRLVPELRARGHEVWRTVRRPSTGPDELRWNVERGVLEGWGPEPTWDGVVHLASANTGTRRWTPQLKRLLWTSRVDATRGLAEWLASRTPPARWVGASAVGYYGSRGDEWLDERSPPGSGFLADLVVAWEGATEPLVRAGTRVRHARMGLVLSRAGGALPRLLGFGRWGLLGPVGGGRQFWSWIAIEDAVRGLVHLLEQGALEGPVNLASPEPVRQREFVATLARLVRRPAVLPVPAAAVRLVLGEVADAMVMASARVSVNLVRSTGFEFRRPSLAAGLAAALEDV